MKAKFIIFLLAFTMVFACNSNNNIYQDLNDGLYAEINTNKGSMLIKLTFEKTPVTVANFVALAEGNHPKVDSIFKGKKFYNGIIFHRVIDKFMIQSGDPEGNGRGGPGYRFLDEIDVTLKHDIPGVLSMANSGPGTNGSQFFITEVPTPHLDGKHTVFGNMVKGMGVLDTISNVKTAMGDRPITDVVIQEINIIRIGSKAEEFDAVTTWNEMEPKLFITQEEKKKATLAKMESLARIEKEKNNNFRAKAKKLNSGIEIFQIIKGNGAKPIEGDEIFFYYEGYLAMNGVLFGTNRKEIMITYDTYSAVDESKGWYEPSKITYSDEMKLIEGFKEALMTMNLGDKLYVYIPSEMGYGERAMGNRIPANSNLEFIIELVDISN
tara:strand:- start:4187 stop:5329 length:1143 start_codon:yes stop_codon:yes gene_type:complete